MQPTPAQTPEENTFEKFVDDLILQVRVVNQARRDLEATVVDAPAGAVPAGRAFRSTADIITPPTLAGAKQALENWIQAKMAAGLPLVAAGGAAGGAAAAPMRMHSVDVEYVRSHNFQSDQNITAVIVRGFVTTFPGVPGDYSSLSSSSSFNP